MWSCQPLTSPQMLLPRSRYKFFFLMARLTSWLFLVDILTSSIPHQDLLTRHKIMCADFLENNYDRVSFLEWFWYLIGKTAHSLPNLLLTFLSGVYRVWKTSALWELRHKTAVFEGTSSCSVLSLTDKFVDWFCKPMYIYLLAARWTSPG